MKILFITHAHDYLVIFYKTRPKSKKNVFNIASAYIAQQYRHGVEIEGQGHCQTIEFLSLKLCIFTLVSKRR